MIKFFLQNCTPKAIKVIVAIVFVLALYFGGMSIYSAFTVGVLSSRACLGYIACVSFMRSVYSFNKEIKTNKVDGIRTLSWIMGLGVPMSFGLATYGIIERDIGIVVFFICSAIFCMFMSIFSVKILNNLKKYFVDENDEKNNK